ncbi:GSCOCG00008588001-RA-CDS [Cotesia congregata]|nr:GSCOCG00008588001-RA-CDS [Cotesia congregata]
MKYGGNSPRAVPAPHNIASTRYGGSGKFNPPHSYAAIVTAAI